MLEKPHIYIIEENVFFSVFCFNVAQSIYWCTCRNIVHSYTILNEIWKYLYIIVSDYLCENCFNFMLYACGYVDHTNHTPDSYDTKKIQPIVYKLDCIHTLKNL